MKLFLTAAILLLYLSGYSQKLSQVTFSNGSVLSWFSLVTNQNILIRISDDGKILEVGTEEQSLYSRNYFAQKLQPFSGRIDYYGKELDSISNGKIKSIGSCFFTYYPSSDYPERIWRCFKIRCATPVN